MAITTIIKRLLGVEDVNWDTDGSDSRFPVETSTGGTRSVKRINSSDIPSTTAAREKKRIGTGTPTTGGKNVDGHLQELYDDLNKIGEPDAATIVVEYGVLKVGTITAGEIGTDAVDTAEIKADAVKTAELDDGAVTTAKLDQTPGSEAVTTATIADKAVDTAQIADLAVEELQIGANVVTPGKLGMDGTTGTFSHYIVAAGTHDWAANNDLQETAVAGVGTSDILVGTVSFVTDDTAALVKYFRVKTSEAGKIEFQGHNIDQVPTTSYVVFRACVT